MAIIKTTTYTGIDTTSISKGDFIRAKYHTWSSYHNGIVAAVRRDEIKVLYIGDGGNVTNYFTITASEIVSELWDLSWSTDLSSVYTAGDE